MKRFMCVLISCLLIFNSTFICYAVDPLTVAGGTSLIGAGLTGEASAVASSSLLGPVGVAVALALTAYGADIYISDKAKAEGVTKKTYIERKLLDYATIEDVAMFTLATNISITANGVYQWTKDAFNIFSDFVKSLQDSDDIVDSIPEAKPSSIYISDYKVYPFVDRENWYYSNLALTSGTCVGYIIADAYIIYVSDVPFSVWFKNSNFNSTVRGNVNYIQIYGAGAVPPSATAQGVVRYNLNSVLNSFYTSSIEYIPATDASDEAIVAPGLVETIDADLASLSNAIGDARIGIGEGLLEGVNVANPALDGTISIGDYAGIVDGVIEGVGSVSVPAVGSIAIPQALSIPRPRVIEKEESTSIANTGSIPVAGSLGGGVYTFDLTEIFPFCLPFDLAHLVGKFQGTPTAPHWEIPFKLSGFFDEVIVLDFAQFNGVARVFRLGEDIIFIACLIFISRKLIMS